MRGWGGWGGGAGARARERQRDTERVVSKFYKQTVDKELLMENCHIAVVAILYNFVKQKLLTDDL